MPPTFNYRITHELETMDDQQAMAPFSGSAPAQLIELKEGFPQLSTLTKAIVFIKASWSGPSVVSFENLIQATRSRFGNCKLFVIQADRIDVDEFVKVYGALPSSGGYGDTYWIRNAYVIYRDAGYYSETLQRLLRSRVQEFAEQ